MNDASEYLHGVSLLTQAIEQALATENDAARVIQMPLLKEDVRFVPKPVGLSPFTELRLGTPQTGLPERLVHLGRELPDRLPIVKLWSGPGRATDTSLLAGRTLLEQMGYDGVLLESSKIPYRVG
jgi:hypothetical protein